MPLTHRFAAIVTALFGLVAHAQPALAGNLGDLALTTAYFGDMGVHPGLSLGAEYPLWHAGWQTCVAAASVGGYTHPGNHTAAFATAGLGYRVTLPAGFSADLSADAGYRHAWVAGDVYAVSPTGTVAPISDGGRPGGLLSLALGLGYDLTALHLGADRVYVKAGTFWEYPVNTFALLHLVGQVGLRWRL